MKIHFKLFACFGILACFLFSGCSKTAEVTLGQYEGLEVSVEKVNVKEEDVEKAMLDDVMKYQDYVEVTDRPVKDGDTANIDYSGAIDGEKFSGGTDTGYDLVIGSGNFIEGFEEQLIGVEVGETVDITVTFPDPYQNNNDLSGKEAVFTVTVNSIKAKETPDEITDEMIKNISPDHTTVEEYKNYTNKKLTDEKEASNTAKIEETVWKSVFDNSTVKNPPKKKVKYYYDLYVSNYQDYADYYSMELIAFVESLGMTEEEFYEEAQKSAEKRTNECAVTEKIANEQNISVTDEEVVSYLDENGYSADEKVKFEEAVRDNLLYTKVIDYLVEQAIVTYG